MSAQRWSIHIDIEGFGALWEREDRVLRALGDLMEGIYRIGTRCYPESPHRIFAHQIGDGFIIVSDFGSKSLDRPVAIGVALMRHVAACGRFARAAIAEGDFADIRSCYPPTIREAIRIDRRVNIGMGLMTIFPVMGTALIRAVGVAKHAPSGSLLLMRKSDRARVSNPAIVTEVPNSDIISVDWVHSEIPLVSEIQSRAHLTAPGTAVLERSILDYCKEYSPPKHWQESTFRLLSIVQSP